MLKWGSSGSEEVNTGAPPGSAPGQSLQNTKDRHHTAVLMRFAYKEAQQRGKAENLTEQPNDFKKYSTVKIEMVLNALA